ncbi:hypothetical protein BGZ49_002320 [Haplosporangium sp. Z 27]|nr:hypothetical protein BGZ49_002320 [Haplosporangium sp. Z 27]
MNHKTHAAEDALDKLSDRDLRSLFRDLVRILPRKEIETSESDFVSNFVSPVLRNMLHMPDDQVRTTLIENQKNQKNQGLVADRADFVLKIARKEISFGIISSRRALSTLSLHPASRKPMPFFSNAGTMQDILFSSLQDGKCIPSWAKNHPPYTFILQLKEEWGPGVTSLYEAAKTKPTLDYTHMDEIALFPGIVHFNKNHIGFSQSDISQMSGEVLNMFYSKEMEDVDMKRAEDATILWASWTDLILLSANTCTTTGKTRKVNLQQSRQSRQPDVIGHTKDMNEVFFGEMKGMRPGLKAVNTDILRLAIFTKDSLDLLHNTLERGPPLVTFQTEGSNVVFFLGARVNNTIVHMRLSTVRPPSSLTEIDLDYNFFFRLFQIQTLISITKDCLEKKRTTPLQEDSFPTLGTPERNAALNTPKKSQKAKQNKQGSLPCGHSDSP